MVVCSLDEINAFFRKGNDGPIDLPVLAYHDRRAVLNQMLSF